MDFRTLLEQRPEIVEDRYSLSFWQRHPPSEIAPAFAREGVVMLKGALPAALIASSAEAFGNFILAGDDLPSERKTADGSWHSPWLVRCGTRFPAADLISAVIRSWAWDVVEEFCRSANIVVLLKFCTARHSVDRLLGVGAHQDAKVVASELPMSIWIPLQPVVPGRNSGLGFVVHPPGGLLPTLPHDDVGADYVLGDPARLWIPRYAPGDLTIHSRFSPHFTTGYGTLSDRFSLEIRAMPRSAAPAQHLDPAIYVARRRGIPTVIDAQSSAAIGATAFLAAVARPAA
jgi:hypothetical protein